MAAHCVVLWLVPVALAVAEQQNDHLPWAELLDTESLEHCPPFHFQEELMGLYEGTYKHF